MAKAQCHVHHLGLIDYLDAWELQRSLASQVHDETRANTLLLMEHPSVYTMGRRGTRDQILLDDAALSNLGIALHDVDRGGQVTYHGPGQLVAYPVVDLRDWGGPLKYVRTLEQVIIGTLRDFGIEAELIEGITGVWVEGRKIAAIGVKISRGVAYHGFAINVSTDLSMFDHIVPCGIPDRGVTSVERVLGRPVNLELVDYSVVYRFGAEMGFRMADSELPLEALAGSTAIG